MKPDAQTGTFGGIRKFYAACSKDLTPRDRRNARAANVRLFAWMLAFVSVSLAVSRDLIAPAAAWVAIGATTAVGIWAVAGYVRFLREADELLRRIQFEALAIGFGAAFVANFTMAMIERVRETPFEIGDMFLVLIVAYAIGVATGIRRYA